MSEALTIRRLIDRVVSGDIRIPAFQRDFVWEADQVAFLMDSIYKNFPIGTVILWRTDNKLKAEKNLGFFELPEPQKDYPVNYVLDDQQRITSIFSVFQTEMKPISSDWIDIYFDMEAKENIQESLFIALEATEVTEGRHFPIKTLFDTVAYRKATADFSDESAKRLDDLQSRFKEYLIPNETFESDDQNTVAIVFERINRSGTELNIFELLSAWSWSEDFDLTDKFSELQVKIADHNFEDLCDDKDLQLKICAGAIRGETTPRTILDLNGEEIRNNFERIERGIIGAIDFLRRELCVAHYKLLPFPSLLVPLAAFFATDHPEGYVYTDDQKREIIKWFWRCLFSRRYSSDVNERQAHDITELLKLRDDAAYLVSIPSHEMKFDFSSTNFSAGTANSKTLILMLAQRNARSFLSGARLDLNKILKKSSRHEFHHIFPRKYLEKQGADRAHINVLANICFLTRGDNNKIRDKAPGNYIDEISKENRSAYLQEALCPDNVAELSYDEFLDIRRSLLEAEAKSLMGA